MCLYCDAVLRSLKSRSLLSKCTIMSPIIHKVVAPPPRRVCFHKPGIFHTQVPDPPRARARAHLLSNGAPRDFTQNCEMN